MNALLYWWFLDNAAINIRVLYKGYLDSVNHYQLVTQMPATQGSS